VKPNRLSLGVNLNRLVLITSVLVILKGFTFFINSFLPVFSQVIKSLATAVLPFIIALLLAFLIEPVVRRLSIKIGRGYASLVSLLMAYSLVGIVLFALINRLHTELSMLSGSFPTYTDIVQYLSTKVQTLQHFINVNPKVKETLYNSTQDLFSLLQTWATFTSSFLLRMLVSLPGTLAIVLVSTIGTYFISSDYPRVTGFIRSLFPKSWSKKVQTVSNDLGSAIFGFLSAQLTLITITLVLTTIGLLILGLDYAFTVGVITGLLEVLPVVGTGILFVPWILWKFVSGQGAFALQLTVMYVIVLAVRQLLEPKILSKNIGLDPLPTLISMYVGLKLLGGWGLILGPTLVIIYQALVKAGVFDKPQE
jgi:sporulation integral membrane protein YtvI